MFSFGNQKPRRIDPSDLWGRPIGRVLTKMRKVSQQQVIEALNAQRNQGGKLGEVMVKMGFVTPEDVEAALKAQRSRQ